MGQAAPHSREADKSQGDTCEQAQTQAGPYSPGLQDQEKESLVTNGYKPSGVWGSRRPCRYTHKPTHPGNHKQHSSWRGANHILEVSEVTGNGVRARQALRSQPAEALPLLLPLPHIRTHGPPPSPVYTQGSAPYNLTGALKQNQSSST